MDFGELVCNERSSLTFTPNGGKPICIIGKDQSGKPSTDDSCYPFVAAPSIVGATITYTTADGEKVMHVVSESDIHKMPKPKS